MSQLLAGAIDFALCAYALSMLLILLRLLHGPSAEDRVLALDALMTQGLLMVLVFGIRIGSAVFFDVALLMALFGFVGSVAMAKFLLRGEVIEP
ncbi:K+/H+ antiporter subunit F [Sinimarinibacterium sp. NLF-5-8]|uniref:K+/H+ antiporter subunit F n=1 Tax=Sinimarinibacterium sp. NLF-5-8 TaxID=2698684 RepID=UPI00137C3852|nr:K+/H+ antiporter subunit F [Sinimarinibacterium sp. NLF-5-8]QHS10842.1 K+/H+ antiporter subunit F [Sinimarinibacterium sp. NLF-5-8]